jgi:PilZ domain
MKPSGQAAPRSNHTGVFVRYVQSLYQILRNRRKFERVPVTGTILATYGRVVPITQTCSCVDMSPRGIAIDSPEPIEPNTFVALRSDERDPKRWARVRYCRPHDVVHRIGLEFIAKDTGAEI